MHCPGCSYPRASMITGSPNYDSFWRRWPLLVLLVVALPLSRNGYSQTASTGALTGVTLDPSGAALPQVSVRVARLDGTATIAVTSDENGQFGFFLLPPGTYEVQASKADFKPVSQTNIQVQVTETLRIELHLELATRA